MSANGQTITGNLILSDEEHFQFLNELTNQPKNIQIRKIRERIARDTLIRTANYPESEIEQYRQTCNISLVISGIFVANYSDPVDVQKSRFLLDILEEQNIQEINIIVDSDGLYVNRKWCGLIVITANKSTNKKLKRFSK